MAHDVFSTCAPAAPRQPRLGWSPHELTQLHQFCDQGLDDEEIAGRLGRTKRAVRTMILRVGGRRLREAPQHWSADELETIVRLNAVGLCCVQIVEHLPGRTAQRS